MAYKRKRLTEDDYTSVLCDPFNATTSARIPDFNCYATNTFTDSREFTFGVNAAGIGGTVILCTAPGAIFWTEAAGTTDANFAYGNCQTTVGYNTTLTIYRTVRLVGLGVKVEFIGNDQNNQGLITAVFCPSGNWVPAESTTQQLASEQINPNAGFLAYGGGTGGSQTNLENSPYNHSGAAKNPLEMTWVPMDPRDLNFQAPDGWNPGGSTFAAPLGTLSGATNVDWPFKGGFIIHVTGAATGAQFRVSIQAHLEGITKTESALDAEFSINDPFEMARAQNLAQAQARVQDAVKGKKRTTGDRTVLLTSAAQTPKRGRSLTLEDLSKTLRKTLPYSRFPPRGGS